VSRENVELIRRGYDALGRRGDWDAAFAGIDPEIEWITHVHRPRRGAARGGATQRRYGV